MSAVPQAPNPTDNPEYYSRLALAMMGKQGIAPSPENYAVWYHYVVSKNRELVKEIDNIINNGLKFTQQTNDYLYNKYILAQNQKAVEDAADGTQKLLQEVLRMMQNFSGETQNYNQDIDAFVGTITQDIDSKTVQDIVRDLVAATATLKQSGEKMQHKLADSAREIESLKKNLQQITVEAQRDFLTGIYNRKTFEQKLDEYIAQSRQTGEPLCLMMIDIDHFKQFNDRFGHLIGDEVIKIVAKALTDTLKGKDIVARYGGEEFVVALPETPIEGALKVAEIIRATIASKELRRRDTGETYGSITVSSGISRFRPGSDTIPMLIKRADDALYESKKNGRNRATQEA